MTSSWTIMSISILILLTAGGLHLIQADEMFVCDYQTHGIYMAFVNGTSSFKDANFTLLPLDNVETPIAIQYDLRSRTIYWTDVAKDAIYRSNINGSGYEKIISDLISPQGLAIDIENDRLYWTDSGLDLVESANLDGSNRTVIADTGHDKPRGIAVSVMHRLVFWSDWGEAPKIERANIDGTNRSVIVSANLAWPNGVTIDSSEDRLYWCEAYHDFVESVLLDGSGRIKQIRTSASVNINPFSIAVRGSDDDIYITDTKYKKIIVLDRSKGTFEFIGSFQSPTGLVINQARIAGVCGADGTEPCLNGVCKDNNGTMECHCFPGYTGATCSQELDECASSPCTNGTCVDLINAFVCICTESSRQIIVNCNPEVRQCAMSPCQNNGTCIDEVYDYECVCIDGYMGKNCEIYIDDCSSNPCINGGTCIDLIAAYSCLCPERYAGTNCEANIDDCSNSPCGDNGVCVDRLNSYQCICMTGYSGSNCHIKLMCSRPSEPPEGTEFPNPGNLYFYGDVLTVSCRDSSASTLWICLGTNNWNKHELVCTTDSLKQTLVIISALLGVLLIVFIITCALFIIYRHRTGSAKLNTNNSSVRMTGGEVHLGDGGISNPTFEHFSADTNYNEAETLPKKDALNEEDLDLSVGGPLASNDTYLGTLDDVPLHPPSYTEA